MSETLPLPEPDGPTLPFRIVDGTPVVTLPEEFAADALREHVRAAAADLAERLGGRPCRLDLGEREIELFQVRRLIQLLREPHGIEVTGLLVTARAVHLYAERELKLDLHLRDSVAAPGAAPSRADGTATVPADLPGLADVLDALGVDDAPAAFLDPEDEPTEEIDDDAIEALDDTGVEPVDDDGSEGSWPARRPIPVPDLASLAEAPEEDAQGGRRTLTLRRTVRSGTLVEYDRDIVVLGDVNSGATVRAGGNVLVLGRLRGVVHAGAQGDEDAVILAFDLSPTQLRIAGHIAIAPERAGADSRPEVAVVREGAILIEPWTGRLPR